MSGHVLLHISRSPGRPMVYGFTPDGRYTVVVYEAIDEHTFNTLSRYASAVGKKVFVVFDADESEA